MSESTGIRLPIALSQTFTAVDETGRAAVIECNRDKMDVCYANDRKPFVSAVNAFMLDGMRLYRIKEVDDWNVEDRYETINRAFRQGRDKEAVPFAMDVLSGR